jgi:hypothetical protein
MPQRQSVPSVRPGASNPQDCGLNVGVSAEARAASLVGVTEVVELVCDVFVFEQLTRIVLQITGNSHRKDSLEEVMVITIAAYANNVVRK